MLEITRALFLIIEKSGARAVRSLAHLKAPGDDDAGTALNTITSAPNY